MRFKIVWLTAVLLILQAFTASSASAEPLRIQSGFLFLSEGGAQSFGLDFGLNGDGFGFVGEDTDTFDYLENFSSSESPFRLRFSGVPDFSSNSSCPGCDYTGDFLFGFEPFTGVGSSAFTMSGLLTGFARGSTQPTISAELLGRGRMTASDSVLFQFEADATPVSEPSTLLLLGTATAFVLRRRRRR